MNFVLSVFAVTVFYCRTPCFPLAIHYCKSFLYSRLLYLELPKKNWFAAINFCNLNVDYLKNIVLKIFEDWFTATNIHNDEAFTNIAKNFLNANKSYDIIHNFILFFTETNYWMYAVVAAGTLFIVFVALALYHMR